MASTHHSSFDIPPDFEGVCTRRQHDGTRLYNSYYQWIPIFLAIQAGMFYIPRCVWLICEGGLMAYIVKGKPEATSLPTGDPPINDVRKKVDLMREVAWILYCRYK